MKAILFVLILMSSTVMASELYGFKLKSAQKGDVDFSQFKGHPVMVVNIATRCGYTGQLDDLEKLYKKYKAKGLKVVAVPSNDFGGQTPEGDKEVAKFCRLKYGVSFPITQKSKVTGESKHPLYKHLVKVGGSSEVRWNFEKFLFDKNGKLVKRYSSGVDPMDESLSKDIEKTL